MKVFVAGATGVLGHRTVAALAAAGHDVLGVARTPEKAELLRGLGASPITVDLFDAESVRDATFGCRAVINLATRFPSFAKQRNKGRWKENDALFRQAARNIANAASETGAEVLVQESITWSYADAGDQWITEDHPYEPSWLCLESIAEGERIAHDFAASGRRGVSLRFGTIYAPDCASTMDVAQMARLSTLMVPGKSTHYVSHIHADDAAAAIASSLELPSGAYNVVDDEPMTWRDYVFMLNHAVDIAHKDYEPGRSPIWLYKISMGGPASYLLRSQRVSAARFKEATGWAPQYPNATLGWEQVVRTADWPFWMHDLENTEKK